MTKMDLLELIEINNKENNFNDNNNEGMDTMKKTTKATATQSNKTANEILKEMNQIEAQSRKLKKDLPASTEYVNLLIDWFNAEFDDSIKPCKELVLERNLI